MLRVVLAFLCSLVVWSAGVGCGPDFPPFWLIQPDPVDGNGNPDPAGKLRVLGLQAEPPEAPPGTMVTVRSLVVIHPQQGVVVRQDGAPVHTPQPQGLSALFLACDVDDSDVQTVTQPCGLYPSGPSKNLEQLSTQSPMAADGPVTQLSLPAGSLPYSRLVTLVVADAALPGGAQACLAQAAANQGMVPNMDHCVIAIKRITVSQNAQPNHNPAISRLLFGPNADNLSDLATDSSLSYPLLDPGTADSDRPTLAFAVERAADAVESGTDPSGQPFTETLTASFFTTAGTLAAGRGDFFDPSCTDDDPMSCAQRAQSEVDWQPPAARAALEAPDQLVYFFVVLRDDRDGLSVMTAAVHGH